MPGEQRNNSSTAQPAPVWDPFLRLFHWALVLFFAIAYVLEGDWPELHAHAGYTVGALVLFRVLWGFMGPAYARFDGFVTSLASLGQYLAQLRRKQASPYIGHDPAGAVMIIALLTVLAITAATGTTLFAMQGSGPFAGSAVASLPGGLIESVHGWAADTCAILAITHVVAVFVMSALHKTNLIRAMVTGKKSTENQHSGPQH